MVIIINIMYKDCIIIGGGIIGMSTALCCVDEGLSVLIVDTQCEGSSSWAAGGILSALPPWQENTKLSQLSQHAQAIYGDYCSRLHQCSGIDPEYIKSGMLWLYDQTAAMDWAVQKGLNYQLMDSDHELTLTTAGLYLPDVYQVRPPRLLKALKQTLLQQGVVFWSDQQISIQLQDRGGLAIHAEQSCRSDYLVIAAGAWSSKVMQQLGYTMTKTVKPMQGQMLLSTAYGIYLNKIIMADGYYLIPRQDEHILIGSTVEDIGFNISLDKKVRQSLWDWAVQICPKLKQQKIIAHWAGLRPATEDGCPMIGLVDEKHQVYVNTAHFRTGILQAPAAAQLLLDIMLRSDDG